jgi:ABC-type sugar transport system ATPase subunit
VPEIIRLDRVSKRFGGIVAVNEVSFAIGRGEIHAVVGENGAGKSTIMKMLAGVHQPDSGTLVLRGEPTTIADPLDARRLGLSIVFQELNLFPHLSVAANIFANRELAGVGGLLDERRMVVATRRILDEMGVDLDPRAKVGKLTVGEKQSVEIARALQQESDIVIMDEPNSALNAAESERLFELLRRLRDRGITIIYVSHRLEEVFAIADRITVIRDGKYQWTRPIVETSIPDVIAAMIGRRLEETFPDRHPVDPAAPVVLEIRDLTCPPTVGPINFSVRAGEIVGFAGLEGSGIDETLHVLFGLGKPTTGDVVYRGTSGARPASPFEAIRQGFALIPANRRDEGLMTGWSIRRNASLCVLDDLLDRIGLVDRTQERNLAEGYVRQLNVATDSIDKRVVNLSGGNQQKVVVAKWLATEPTILILNDPTRGVDIGAKSEIYALCDRLAQGGMALLFTSSEIEETLGVSDRVLVFYKGRIIRQFARGEASKADVMHWVAGGVIPEVRKVEVAQEAALRLPLV